MIRRLGFLIGIGFLIIFATGSSALAKAKADAKLSEENEKAAEIVTAGETVTADDTVTAGETVTFELSDLEPVNEDWLIGYKDENYYNRRSNPEFSHNTVIVAVDAELLDTAKVNVLCEKYGLSITYDYETFEMYALSSEKEMSDEELNKLIDDLSQEEGILSVSKDYICYTTSDPGVTAGFGLFTE